MSIAIICPTRGRPEQFRRMCNSAAATASTPIRVISGSNGNDSYVDRQFPIDCPTVHVWNMLVMGVKADLFMLGADDTIFSTPMWDTALLEHYNNLENKIHVYAFQDSRDKTGTPHPIVTKEYIEAMGYFLPPIFNHWQIDTWTVAIAKANNCFTHMNDYLLTHDKPSDKGIQDDTYIKTRQSGWRERDQYVNISCQHFLEIEKHRLGVIIQNNKSEGYIREVSYAAGQM